MTLTRLESIMRHLDYKESPSMRTDDSAEIIREHAEFAQEVLLRAAEFFHEISDTRDPQLLDHPLFVNFFRDIGEIRARY